MMRSPNANTRFVAAGPRVEALWLDEAYARARDVEAPPMTEPGVRLFWWRGDEMGWHDLVAHPKAHAVVGRHTKCDVVLPSDSAVALRHLLVRATTLDDGSPAVHVLDLRTGLGFHLDDDVERRGVVASGVLALRVGRYALLALPSLCVLPERRPAPEIVDLPHLPLRSRRSVLTSSSITLVPPLSALEDVARDAAAPGHGKVTLRRDGAWATVELPDQALEAGVLVGRADRCESQLRSVLTESVSRVHVLLLREHGAVHAFDVASMQGLWAGDRQVRRVRLSEEGGTLRLASKNPVLLEWHPQGAPTGVA
jgi:hypothetical protein